MKSEDFKKNRKKTGGRKKGTPNQFTNLKDAFLGAFEDIGGRNELKKWAKSNKESFYKMITKMLPSNVQVDGNIGVEVKNIEKMIQGIYGRQ